MKTTSGEARDILRSTQDDVSVRRESLQKGRIRLIREKDFPVGSVSPKRPRRSDVRVGRDPTAPRGS